MQGHRVTIVGDVKLLDGRRAIRLEAAERVGQSKTQAFIQPSRDFDVDPAPVVQSLFDDALFAVIARAQNIAAFPALVAALAGETDVAGILLRGWLATARVLLLIGSPYTVWT